MGGGDLDYFDAHALSELFLIRGSLESADRLAQRCTQLEPNSADDHAKLASCKIAVGEKALAGRDVQTATGLLKQAVASPVPPQAFRPLL